MIKKFVTLLLALLLFSSMSLLGQDKSLRTKAPMKTEPINIQQFQTELGTDAPSFAENYVAVDTMSNSFGPATPTINPLCVDPYSNILAVVHRGNANTYALGSGELWWNYSTDMGATWPRSTTSVQNSTTSQILARYPSMTIFNPTGATALDSLWGAFSWPELLTSFAYLGYGVTIGMETAAFAEIDFDLPPYGSNVPTFSDDTYIYWLSDENTNAGGDFSIHLFRTTDYSVVEKIDPPTWADSMFTNGNITMGAVAYNGVLYAGTIGTFIPEIGLGGWEAGYSKSTDHGATWSDWFIPDWHFMTGLEDYEELWDFKKDDAFVSYAGDIQVDKDGLVHLLVGLTNMVDSTDERGYNAVVEFFETSEGVWDYLLLAEGDEATDSSLYATPDDAAGNGQDPGLGQCGPSFMLATNMDRDFLMAQWVVAPNTATDSVACDLFYQTRALTDMAWSPMVNMTETDVMNESGAHLAPYLATVTNANLRNTYGFSMFWYEAGNTGRLVNSVNPSVVYIAPVLVKTDTLTSVQNEVNGVMNYSLVQNYPNPFNPSTSISFTIPSKEFVTLKVYDILGNEVARLVNEERNAGLNSIVFDASNLATGMYVYTITAGQFTSSKKMMLLK